MKSRLLACGAAALCLAGCATTIDPHQPATHVTPLQGSDVVSVSTPYSPTLACLSRYAASTGFEPPRIAVGHITDLTGADDYFTGRRLTQGATLMAMSAVNSAGMRLVERYDTGVVQVDLDYARNQLLHDGSDEVRQVQAGQIEGTDLYLIGGITEYNPNIRSGGARTFASSAGENSVGLNLGERDYIIDVGMDLRLVDARTTEVIAVRALRKQIRGREVEAGLFAFFDGNLVDVGSGERALEPVQTAVRSMIDRAVAEFVRELYSLPEEACASRPAAPPVNTASTSNGTPDAPQPHSSPVTPPTQSAELDTPQAHAPQTDDTGAGYGIHLASYRSVESARFGWYYLTERFPDSLSGRHARLAPVDDLTTGLYRRLLIGPWRYPSDAQESCNTLRQAGVYCEVEPFSGEPLG